MELIKCENPIGVIDSGVGGLTVLVRLIEAMPDQPFLYIADQDWCPYGPRAPKEVKRRVFSLVEYLLGRGCQFVVLACNTATAAAVDALRRHYNVPFVGMEPAIKPAALTSKTHHVGVLATEGTFSGALFQRTAAACKLYAQLHLVVGQGLVELVESGRANSEDADEVLRELLAPLLVQNIDRLVLGCTHYPLLQRALERVLPPTVEIQDSASAIAKQALRIRSAMCNVKPTPADVALELISTKENARLLEFAKDVFAFYQYPFPPSSLEKHLIELPEPPQI